MLVRTNMNIAQSKNCREVSGGMGGWGVDDKTLFVQGPIETNLNLDTNLEQTCVKYSHCNISPGHIHNNYIKSLQRFKTH